MRDNYKVVFLGNSITRHELAPDIGWYGEWGMAASSEEKDYVHILISYIRKIRPEAQFIIKNIADFERSFWSYNSEQLVDVIKFQADLIVVRLGENVEEKELPAHNFGKYLTELINTVNSKNGLIICTNSFWERPETSRQIKTAAIENGYAFVDIGPLGKVNENMAKDSFWHEGVGAHPSDTGMKRIADLIWEKMKINMK